jgi:threonine dehydrogenase-like Zn-dependent dehydrogenase
MQVATWRGETRFTLDEVPEPVPGPGEVLVAVHTAGICGSDVHATQGLFPVTPPRVLGHEYSGRVVAVGPGVSPRLRGRPVACEPNYGCGDCPACREGRDSQCVRCVRVGGFAERVVLPRRSVHPLPPGLEPATAALAEPAACCLAGLETFRMPPVATVVVLGGGLMGLLTLALARARGARTAVLSDPLPSRRALAERLGADLTVDPTREDLAAAVARLTGGRGADVACEAVGKPELVAEAVRLVRPRGIVQLVGVNPPGSRLAATSSTSTSAS